MIAHKYIRAVMFLFLALVCAQRSSASGEGDEASGIERIAGFFTNYCLDCHSSDDPPGGVDLEAFSNQAAFGDHAKVAEKVIGVITNFEMPPEEMPQPSPEERERLAEWINAEIDCALCSGPADPGRVTIRRLNRAEYNNTIRDLLALEFQPAEDFPADDVGFGFDNIGDVLSLSPLLLEKYLSAAEEISNRAVVVRNAMTVPAVRFNALLMRDRGARRRERGKEPEKRGEFRVFRNGTPSYVFRRFRENGTYKLRISAAAAQENGEPIRLSVHLDEGVIATFDVSGTREEPQTFEVPLKVERGGRRISVSFANPEINAEDNEHSGEDGDDENEDKKTRDAEDSDSDSDAGDRVLLVDYLELEGPLEHAEDVNLPASYRKVIYRDILPDEDELAYIKDILQHLASRAFRRPAQTRDIEKLAELATAVREDGGTLDDGFRLALRAILVSPKFLFRIEADPQPNTINVVRELDDFELATRLSYFLWSSMPDEELFEQAMSGTLRANLESQTMRMLADSKAIALVENFGEQWLTLRELDSLSPDPELFPGFNAELRSDMLQETRLFFETVLREDRSIFELLDADFTWLNGRLARHYGIDGVEGEKFQRVSLQDTPRGGVLTQASVLTVTSNPTRTSPVKRGKWILEQILGTPPPPPPPDVPELQEEENAVLSGSLRERMEQHRDNPNCAVCHRRMDPIGFGLENFNAVGAWRTHDSGFEIDPSGKLPDGSEFNGPGELKNLIQFKEDQFRRAFARNMLTYALGRGLEPYDQCAINDISAKMTAAGDRFSSLILAIASSGPFQKRRGVEEVQDD